MIVLIRGSRLVEQLKNDSVPELHKLFYLTLPFIFSYLCDLLLPSVSYSPSGQATYLKLATYILGVGCVFYINKKGDDSSFIARYICLSFPATVVINLIGFTYGLVIVALLVQIFGTETTKTIGSVFFKLNGALFYILVGYWMFRTSQKSSI